eukprot:757492-Prorocentrum_minimum.AAC.1
MQAPIGGGGGSGVGGPMGRGQGWGQAPQASLLQRLLVIGSLVPSSLVCLFVFASARQCVVHHGTTFIVPDLRDAP